MELKNYNFKFNTPVPSSEDINTHKDFDALLNQLDQQPKTEAGPAPRRWLYYISGAVAAALVGLWAINNSSDTNQYQAQAAEYFESQPYVNPPLENVAPKFASQTINATKGGAYTFKNGSVVTVPADAFVDFDGNPVDGEVAIQYKEYHDYVDFFLSGIPLEYDSAGVQYLLESAGMVEIYAEQEGKRVNMAPGKEVRVELVSEITVAADQHNRLPDFNIYSLDQSKRNWVYEGKDNIEVISEETIGNTDSPAAAINREYQEALASIQQYEDRNLAQIETSIQLPKAPVEPTKSNEDFPVFDLNFLDDLNTSNEAEREINQLKQQYADNMWQINPAKNVNLNLDALQSIQWEDAAIRTINEQDYELTLTVGNRKQQLTINPVLSAAEYESALVTFNQRIENYNAQIADRKAVLAEQKIALEKEIEEKKALAAKAYDDQIATLRASGKDYAANDLMIRKKIVNRFTATNFGIWNCDRPLPPYVSTVKGEFVDTNKKEFEDRTVYLVDKTRNTVCRFYATKGAEVFYNESGENLMWIVTKDNKLAVYPPEKFKRINQDKDDYTFVMNLIDKPVKSEEDIRKILEF